MLLHAAQESMYKRWHSHDWAEVQQISNSIVHDQLSGVCYIEGEQPYSWLYKSIWVFLQDGFFSTYNVTEILIQVTSGR